MCKKTVKSAKLRQKAYKRGLMAEVFSAVFLSFKGYRILKHRYKTPFGEIDLVLKKGNTLVFVEVKARSNKEDAAFAITHKQKKRIEDAANMFLGSNPSFANYFCRFDVVLVAPLSLPTHITNAWQVN